MYIYTVYISVLHTLIRMSIKLRIQINFIVSCENERRRRDSCDQMIVEIRQLGTLIYNNVSILTIYEIIPAQIGSTKNHAKVKTTRKKEDNENKLF